MLLSRGLLAAFSSGSFFQAIEFYLSDSAFDAEAAVAAGLVCEVLPTHARAKQGALQALLSISTALRPTLDLERFAWEAAGLYLSVKAGEAFSLGRLPVSQSSSILICPNLENEAHPTKA